MNSQKFKSDSYCAGGKHRSGTKNITGEITVNKKTGKQIKLLVGKCLICDRKKSMIVSDNTIQAEGLGDFFNNLGKKGLNPSKKMAKNVLSNPGRALDLTAKIATAATSRNSKQVLSTLPELISTHIVDIHEKGIITHIKVCINKYKYSYSSYTQMSIITSINVIIHRYKYS